MCAGKKSLKYEKVENDSEPHKDVFHFDRTQTVKIIKIQPIAH